MGREISTGPAICINQDFFLEHKDMKKLFVEKDLQSFTGVIGYRCRDLEAIDVDEENEYFASRDGILYSKDMRSLLRYPSGKDGRAIRLRESVETIKENALSHVARLADFYTGPTLKTVDYDAFNGCSRLETIHIGRSVSKFSVSSTSSCWKLKEFVVDPENETYAAFDGCLYTKDLQTLLRVPVGHRQDVIIPNEGISFSRHCLLQWKGPIKYIVKE